tara:strand:+ start:207 stop:593 length:387 start_codon:yes stop_codon:yes gene_type:complete
MQDPKLFKINEKDKEHYRLLIKNIDISKRDSIISILGIKIQKILDRNKLNNLEVGLIDDMSKLIKILQLYTKLPDRIVKKILFAMSYFIDENDDIPDVIPDYGYLDDIAVVRWIIDDIDKEIPELSKA